MPSNSGLLSEDVVHPYKKQQVHGHFIPCTAPLLKCATLLTTACWLRLHQHFGGDILCLPVSKHEQAITELTYFKATSFQMARCFSEGLKSNTPEILAHGNWAYGICRLVKSLHTMRVIDFASGLSSWLMLHWSEAWIWVSVHLLHHSLWNQSRCSVSLRVCMEVASVSCSSTSVESRELGVVSKCMLWW